MKAKFFTIAMALLVGAFVTSCDDDDADVATPAASISPTPDNSSGVQSDPGQSAGKIMAGEMISGRYRVQRFFDGGQDLTSKYSGVTFLFGPQSIMYGYSDSFEYQGKYAVDTTGNTMLMQISGNELMSLISGNYAISNMTNDGIVTLVSMDGMKAITFAKNTQPNFSGPIPNVTVPGRGL